MTNPDVLLQCDEPPYREEWRALVENVHDCISRYDCAGRLLYVNPAVERLWGIPAHRLIGRKSMEHSPGPRAQLFYTTVCEVASTNSPREIEAKFDDVRPGQTLWHQVIFAPERDLCGNVVSVIAIGRDITALKESAAQLRQREREFRTLAEHLPDVVARVDLDGTYRYVSPVVEAHCGLKPEAFIGTRVGDTRRKHGLAGAETVRRVRESLNRALSTGVPQELELIGNDGRHFFEFRFVPEHEIGGAVKGALIITRDVTRRRLAEDGLRRLNTTLEARVAARTCDLERANRDLESFAHTVSHDLRAPLRSISAFTQLLQERDGERLSPQGCAMLQRISAAGVRLGQLIDDILEYSRAGQNELRKQPVAMKDLAREVAGELQNHNPAARIVVADLPDAEGDPTMLRQVLQNLMGNALKFSAGVPEPLVEVSFRVEVAETVYYVRDNGVGFDMQYAAKLCSMFHRLHAGQQFPGSGVGLAIVKRLIERHEGRVWAEGHPGAGATFYFALPHRAAVGGFASDPRTMHMDAGSQDPPSRQPWFEARELSVAD